MHTHTHTQHIHNLQINAGFSTKAVPWNLTLMENQASKCFEEYNRCKSLRVLFKVLHLKNGAI